MKLRAARAWLQLLPVLLAAAPAAAHAAGIDGPGDYFIGRTFPNAAEGPTEGQQRGCDEHFGSARSIATYGQHALTFAVRTNAATGFVTDEDARYIGHSYICAGPHLGQDPIEAYAQAEVLPFTTLELDGTCSPSPSLGAALYLGCRHRVHPDPSVGLRGGYAMQLATAGSLVSVYTLLKRGAKFPDRIEPGPEPRHNTLANDPDFFLFRAFDQTTPRSSPICRRSALSGTAPNLANARLDPDELLYRDASLTLCFTGAGADARPATAVLKLRRGGREIEVNASGDCREVRTPAGAELRQQTCVLPVQSVPEASGFRGGMLTSNGLVPAGAPLRAANSHVWILALLADPVTDPRDRVRPRVRLRLPSRSADRVLRARWRGRDRGPAISRSRIRDYTLQLRRAGRRWRTVERSTTASSARLRLRGGERYLVRVRAFDRAGNASRWAKRVTTVGWGR